jgi:TPR repeat protein
MAGKSGKFGLKILFIAYVGKYVIKKGKCAAFGHGQMKAGLGHEAEQAGRLYGSRLPAGVDAGNNQDARFRHKGNIQRHDTALAIWQPLAEAGDAESQYGLGMMYGNGFGVAMDDALAIKWYGMAAEQGHADALCNLAVMHQNGWGVPLNEEEAIRLFTLAAEQGAPEAMVALGRFFAMDFSEAYDPVQAYKWFSLAALLDDIDAKVKRENIAEKLTVEQVADGNAMVELWSNSHTGLLAKQ